MSKQGKSIEEIILERKIESLKYSSSNNIIETLTPLRKKFNNHSRLTSSPKPFSNSNSSISYLNPIKNEQIEINQRKSSLKQRNSDKEIIESLLEHSRELQERNKELESQLLISQNTISKLLSDFNLNFNSNSININTNGNTNGNGNGNKNGILSDKFTRLDSISSRLGSRKGSPLEPLSILIPQASPQQINSFLSPQPIKTLHHPKSSHGRSNLHTANHNNHNIHNHHNQIKNNSFLDSSAMNKTVSHMEQQLTELRHMFDGTDPLEQRWNAAIKLQTSFRAYSTRKKYHQFKLSFQSWRFGRSKKFLPVIEKQLLFASKIEMAVKSMIIRREYLLVIGIFSRWKHIYKQSAPFRMSMRTAAEEKYLQVLFRLKAQTFAALKDGTLGIDSHKQIRKERRKMIENAKAKIHANMIASGMNGILISDEEVKRVVYREIVASSLLKQTKRNTIKIFQTFKQIYLESLKNNKIAYNHKFKKYAGKCFYAWSDWTYQIGTGLERKRWIGPRKYEVRYNQKLVEHFSRTRLKRTIMAPWKRYTKISCRVNKLYMIQITRFVKTHLLAWKYTTKRFIYLRNLTIQNWKDYSLIVISPTFYAWKQYASTATIRRIQQNSLVSAYLRWKNRQKNIKILRVWRHQSLYGGIEGMYSRTNISKSLGEQKGMCVALQKLLSKQMVDMEECKEAVHKETTLRKKMEDRVAERDTEIEVLKVKLHHLDMELKRLHGIIDAMAVVNPKQVNYIKNIQPEFEFRERKLQPSLDVASDDDLYKLDDPIIEKGKSDNNNINNSGISSSQDLNRSSQNSRTGSRSMDRNNNNNNNNNMNNMNNTSNSNAINSNTQNNSLPLEDRRLLVRVKWLLKRLFTDPEEGKINVDILEKKLNSTKTQLNDDFDENDEINEIEQEKLRAEQQRRASQFIKVEEILKNLLTDKADRKETLFVLNILSFLKDGNAKCLGEEDCRSWTEELLQSVGRNPDIVSSIMGGTKSGNEIIKKSNQLSNENKIIDMESWREILIHLRTNYPIGLISESIDVHFNESMDTSHIGTLNRIKLMRNELQEVIQYKRDTYEASRSGTALSASINLKENHSNFKKNIHDRYYNDSNNNSKNDNIEVLKHEPINLYSQNIPAELGIQITSSESVVNENLSKYDKLLLKSPNVNNFGILTQGELEGDFQFKSK